MGPVSDDDERVTRTGAEVPVKSESQQDAGGVAERDGKEAVVEEWPIPVLEEAGYGYGV
jgi:hypothetical protein